MLFYGYKYFEARTGMNPDIGGFEIIKTGLFHKIAVHLCFTFVTGCSISDYVTYCK